MSFSTRWTRTVPARRLRGHRENGEPQFDVAVVPYARTVTLDAVTADITRETPSLFAAFDAAGESVALPFVVADMFSGEIDFNSELQRGDSASVLFERVRRENGTEDYGDVQAAVLNHGGKRFVGIRFNGADGKAAWYDERGRSLKREFLKSPLPFEPRITSRFSGTRLHPVFGDVRAHLGVDYAAPTGVGRRRRRGVVEFADWAATPGAWSRFATASGLETSPAPLVVRRRHSPGGARVTGTAHRTRRHDRRRHRPAPRFPREAERQTHQPCRDAEPDAAGRADRARRSMTRLPPATRHLRRWRLTAGHEEHEVK